MHLLVALAAAAISAARIWLQLRARQERTWRWWLGWGVPVAAAALAAAELGLLPSLLVCEKIVGALLEPLGLLWLALWTLAAVACAQRRWRWACAVGACALALTLVGNAWLADALVASLESRVPASPPPSEPYDAVLVLGGGTDRGSDGRPELWSGGDRVLRAFELFQAGKARRLIASGSHVPGMERAHSCADETTAIWLELGVPPRCILTSDGPDTTSAEIAHFAEEARAQPWRHLAVVTSAWHMPRAMRLCRKEGLSPDAVPCDYRGMRDPFSLVWVVPHGVMADRLSMAMWEYLAWLAGR